jgi:hypothetical protein
MSTATFQIVIQSDTDWSGSIRGGTSKAGFEASIYELNVKGYLAIFLSQINLDDFLKRADDADALTILGAITGTT